MSLVLDCSATLAWIYGDETIDAIRAVFDEVVADGAVVPGIWKLEVGNSLTMAVRRGRIDADFRRSALSDLGELEIRIDSSTDAQAWAATVELADRHILTFYDAAYLEHATRLGLALATLDRELAAGAAALGVRVLGV